MKCRRIAIAATVIGALSLASPPASAVDCSGHITLLGFQLDGTGLVTLGLTGGPNSTYICSTEGTPVNGVPLSVCKTLYGSLLAAKLAEKKVLIRFNDHTSCAAVPNWGSAGSLGWTMQALE